MSIWTIEFIGLFLLCHRRQPFSLMDIEFVSKWMIHSMPYECMEDDDRAEGMRTMHIFIFHSIGRTQIASCDFLFISIFASFLSHLLVVIHNQWMLRLRFCEHNFPGEFNRLRWHSAQWTYSISIFNFIWWISNLISISPERYIAWAIEAFRNDSLLFLLFLKIFYCRGHVARSALGTRHSAPYT